MGSCFPWRGWFSEDGSGLGAGETGWGVGGRVGMAEENPGEYSEEREGWQRTRESWLKEGQKSPLSTVFFLVTQDILWSDLSQKK